MVSKISALGDNISILFSLTSAAFHASLAFVSYPFLPSTRKHPTLARQIYQASVFQLLKRLSILQLQKVLPPSTKCYQHWITTQAAKQDAPDKIHTEVLEGANGAKIHWVGNESATRVIFYLHSGGFVLPLNNGHINLANSFRRHIINKTSGHVDVKIAFLEYTLTPEATYPTQLHQSLLALQHILSTTGIAPNHLLICGDSAGGMLAFQILSHILHPYPHHDQHRHFPSITIPPETPLAGILAMSPWVIFDSTAPACVGSSNSTGLDILSPGPLKTWADAVRKGTAIEGNQTESLDGGSGQGYWAEPGKAPARWWHGADKVVRSVLVTSGAWEILNDDIQALGKVLGESAVDGGGKWDARVMVEDKGMHIGPTVDSASLRPPNEFTSAITAWVYERLTC